MHTRHNESGVDPAGIVDCGDDANRVVVTCDHQPEVPAWYFGSSGGMIGWRQAQHDLHQCLEGTAIVTARLPDAAIMLPAVLQGGDRLRECGVGWFEPVGVAWLIDTLPFGE